MSEVRSVFTVCYGKECNEGLTSGYNSITSGVQIFFVVIQDVSININRVDNSKCAHVLM